MCRQTLRNHQEINRKLIFVKRDACSFCGPEPAERRPCLVPAATSGASATNGARPTAGAGFGRGVQAGSGPLGSRRMCNSIGQSAPRRIFGWIFRVEAHWIVVWAARWRMGVVRATAMAMEVCDESTHFQE